MRVIDQESWPRRKHFDIFRGFDHPHISVSVRIDVTTLWQQRRQLGASPTTALVYVLTKAANRVPELRQRIRGEQVVEHDVIHPLIPILGNEEMFTPCCLTYDACFSDFTAGAKKRIAEAKDHVSLDEWLYDQDGNLKRDDLLSITIIPWFSPTSLSLTRPSGDSIPLLSYGKVLRNGDRFELPVSIDFHHGLVDGLHVARFIAFAEEEAKELASHAMRQECERDG